MQTESDNQMQANPEAVEMSCYNSFEQAGFMKDQWDSFVEAICGDIFLTYDWCRIWWKFYGKNRDLKVFIFRNNGKLVGIIPLFFERIRLGPVSVRAAKIVGSDFTLAQFSLPLADGYIRPAVKKLYELISKDTCDIIHIGPVAGLYSRCDELKNSLTEFFGNSHYVLLENKNVQTYFEIANDWESQLSGISKAERKHIKQSYKHLSESSRVITSNYANSDDFEKIFNEFVKTHQSHWNKLGKAGHFEDWPDARDFHLEMAKTQLQKGRLKLLKVTAGQRCLGYEYSYKLGDIYFAILSARPEENKAGKLSLGKIIFGEFVKKSMHEKIKYIDSMQGKYEHKLRLGGKLFHIKSIYVMPRKNSAKLRVYLFRLCARLLNLYYYKLWYCRIAPKLSLARKPLWKTWIRTNAFV
jgi:CelD/BcsL family acetyltransferase involved in cellulose biosynthesis